MNTVVSDQSTIHSIEDYRQIATEFFQDGCALLRGVFDTAQVTALRDKTDYYYAMHRRDDGSLAKLYASYAMDAFVLRRCAELAPLFASVLTHAPILAITEAVLGPDPRFNAMNVIRNEPGTAISRWHVDDVVEFPLPDNIPRFDSSMRMPVFWFTVQVALSDIDTIENGPTQYVPTSHYSGRRPENRDDLEFDGHGPKAIYCKAGDIYLTNHQTWHRGSPNTSNRTRYVMQMQFAQRWADARFKGIA